MEEPAGFFGAGLFACQKTDGKKMLKGWFLGNVKRPSDAFSILGTFSLGSIGFGLGFKTRQKFHKRRNLQAYHPRKSAFGKRF